MSEPAARVWKALPAKEGRAKELTSKEHGLHHYADHASIESFETSPNKNERAKEGAWKGALEARTQAKTKEFGDLRNRQKIFEEEIIKRVKEIQKYVKSLHLQVKKNSSTSE